MTIHITYANGLITMQLKLMDILKSFRFEQNQQQDDTITKCGKILRKQCEIVMYLIAKY